MDLTINQFMEFKGKNMDILPELRIIANNMNFKHNPQQLYNKNKFSKHNKNNNIINKNITSANNDSNMASNTNGPKFEYRKKKDVYQHDRPDRISRFGKNKLTPTNDDQNNIFSFITKEFNKLSSSNINNVCNVIKKYNIKEHNIIDTLIDEIFKKAAVENKFTNVYAKLCSILIAHYNNDEHIKGYFRSALLNKCQAMFIDGINFCENLPSAFTSKDSIIGLYIFLGNLYNEKILTLKIITYCCMSMLEKIESGTLSLLDLFLQLLMTISGKYYKESPDINDIFDKLNVLKNNVNLSKKEKFAIMDLLDAK